MCKYIIRVIVFVFEGIKRVRNTWQTSKSGVATPKSAYNYQKRFLDGEQLK